MGTAKENILDLVEIQWKFGAIIVKPLICGFKAGIVTV